jgi:hypothetical protein
MADVGPEAEEAYVTIAEMRDAKGQAKGRAETLVELLDIRFGPLPEAVLTTVRDASTESLKVWTARVLTIETLDQLFDWQRRGSRVSGGRRARSRPRSAGPGRGR